MKGKIFNDSVDVTQDQAKVAFDFLKSAAEKIVSQEEEIETRIKEKESEKNEAECLLESAQKSLGTKNTLFYVFIAVGVIGVFLAFIFKCYFLLLFIGLPIWGYIELRNIKQQIADLEYTVDNCDYEIGESQKEFDNIFRDYKIEKMGVAYIPVAKSINVHDKSVIVDYSGIAENSKFELKMVKQPQLIDAEINKLHALTENAPIVETDFNTQHVDTSEYSQSIQNIKYYDYLASLENSIKLLGDALTDITTSSVKLPVVMPGSELSKDLRSYATDDTGNSPVLDFYNINKYESEIAKFEELNNQRMTSAKAIEEFEQELNGLMGKVASTVHTVGSLKVSSANKLVSDSNKLLFKILRSSFNHYSQELEADQIEKLREENFNYSDSVNTYSPFNLKPSSRVRYNVISDIWEAEDGSKTNTPFAISQIQEEIISPIVQNLLEESRVERLRIYNNIKDQKISYLNKWHQDTEAFYGRNRTTSDDLRNLMRTNLTKFLTAQTTLQSLDKMKQSMTSDFVSPSENEELEENNEELVSAYDMQTKDFESSQNDFEDYINDLKDDIDDKADTFGYIEYFDGSLRDKVAKDTVTAGDNIAELDNRRKILLGVNAFCAAKSEIPPMPSVEELADEHMSIDLNAIAKTSMNVLSQENKEEQPA